mgnify:CR=1 FL=1
MPRKRPDFMYPRGFIEEKRSDGVLSWDECDELEDYDDDGLLPLLELEEDRFEESQDENGGLGKWGLGIIGDDDNDWL